MGWCTEYQAQLDELMQNWQDEIKGTLIKDAPQWNSTLGVGKSETALIDDRYRVILNALKAKYNI